MSLEDHTFAKFPFMKEWAFKVIFHTIPCFCNPQNARDLIPRRSP